MAVNWEDVLKLVLAMFLGGIIGAEREYQDKAAGLRTMIFISVGATLFTVLSRRLSTTGDPGRIAAQIVSGVGFLGAGAILHQRGQVKGLTTAATVWLVAAIGMAVGSDQVALAIAVSAMALIVLAVLPTIEQRMTRGHYRVAYDATCALRPALIDELRTLFAAHGLRIHAERISKGHRSIRCQWLLWGSREAHAALLQALLAHDEVLALRK
ncbi:MAG: MgtC/SapB family protein [Candidatus Eisenbacteria bacterium]|nr:MgtC/SapB family protein [Candidatus Eisenbacteria bacterium]